MNRWLACIAMAVASSVHALAVEPTDLPAREAVARWIASDPALRAAASARIGAGHEAGMLRASPNEWTLSASGQSRSYDSGGRSREWNVGVERSVRLPAKKRLDAQLGDSVIGVADAQQVDEVRQALLDLVELWIGWAAAEAAGVIAEGQVGVVNANRTSVEKRVKAGDAARLDLNLAELDVADSERLQSEYRTAARNARAELAGRFPDLPAAPPALSEPAVSSASIDARIARLTDGNSSTRVAEAALGQENLQVERERAERWPDPRLGVFSASEAFGDERIVGVSVSVPLPGRYRSEKLGRTLALRDQREALLERTRQQARTAAAVRVSEVDGGVERWRLAEVAAARSDENLRLVKRAYALGEADLQTLLLARKQALDTDRTALESRATALIASYRERIESGELWNDAAR